MRRTRVVVAATASAFFGAAFIGLGAGPRAALGDTADFAIDFHAVAVDPAAQTATFTIQFNRPPDFSTAPGDGQVNGFVYEVDADGNTFDAPLDFDDIDSVVRGAEIAGAGGGSEIPIRERDGDGGPDAGGWGPLRGLVPFELDGQTLTFATGLSDLGDTDGRFRYRLIALENGELTSTAQGAVIPLPAPVWGGAMMLGGLGAARVFRKANCRSL
jgi:hypothetical protein